LTVDLTTSDDAARFPLVIELGLYRIAMELINNTIKHANAKHIAIRLSLGPENLDLIYLDDGIGLPSSYLLGRGFSNIETRVNVMGGTFDVDKKNAKGFKASVTVPTRIALNS
jgi:signal transduction histidine kinase